MRSVELSSPALDAIDFQGRFQVRHVVVRSPLRSV